MATQLSGPRERGTVDRMNSYNRTKKGTGRQTIDRFAGLDRKSSRRIPIATLKKQSWFAMDIAAGLPGRYRYAPNRFRRQKKLANRTPVFRAVAALTKPSSEVESDVFGAYNKGIRGGATVSATEFRRAAARSGVKFRTRRSTDRAGGRGSVAQYPAKLLDRIGARKIFGKGHSHQSDFRKKRRRGGAAG